MSVRRHRNQVAVLLLGYLENLVRRVAAREVDANLEARATQRHRIRLEIALVPDHFFRVGQAELLVVARRPAVGDVYQQQL